MASALLKKIIRILRETATKLEEGNSELSESEMLDIMNVLCHQALSKADACKYLNIQRSRFGELIRLGQLPRGRKRVGFNELVWYRDELDEYVKRLKQ